MSMDWPDTTPYDPRRLVHRLTHYWQEKAAGRLMPEENDIDPDDLGTDWDYCFVLQARDLVHIEDYNFTYLGDRIRKAYFDTGALDQFNEFMIGPNARCLSPMFERVIDHKKPIIDENQFMSKSGRSILYRQCILPLGTPQKGVEVLFGGMNYKLGE